MNFLPSMQRANAMNIAGVYETAKQSMATGATASIGDIVICSVDGKWNAPDNLGVVLCVKAVKLPEGHPDGDLGEVFVHPYQRQKRPARKTLECIFARHIHTHTRPKNI